MVVSFLCQGRLAILLAPRWLARLVDAWKAKPKMKMASMGHKSGSFRADFGYQKQKRIPFLKNEPERLLKTKVWLPKTNLNEPKNEAEKLLKTRSCEKNEPKTNLKTD